MSVVEITVEDLKEKLDRGEELIILDVRDQDQHDACNLGGRSVPFGELESRLTEIDETKPIVVHCGGGTRGRRAAELLQQHGYTDVKMLTGGMRAWIERIDPSLKL